MVSRFAALLVLGILTGITWGASVQEERALEALQERGAMASRDDRAPGAPVTWVTCYRPIQDEDLDLLAALPHLANLVLLEGGITDAGLKRLQRLPRLASLWLTKTNVTDKGLSHLQGLPHLRRLHLVDVPIGDEGLATLARLKRLRIMGLRDTRVSDEGVARLKKALPYALVHVFRTAEQRSEEPGWGGLLIAAGALVALGILAACRPLRRSWAWKPAVVLVLILAVGAAILRLAPRMAPLREGDPATFWLHACRIDVGTQWTDTVGGYYLPRDGWFLYYVQGFHGHPLRRVPAADAEALFPAVVEKLQNAPAGLLDPDVEKGFQAWRRADSPPGDAIGLLVKIREARQTLGEEAAFDEHWQRIGRYSWSVLLEFCFFAVLILFAAWPWLTGAGSERWAVHLGLVPVLFFLPYWLGYAPLTFTSLGPQSGVLYPHLLLGFRGLPWTSLDTTLVGYMPQVFEPLSQMPGPVLSLTSFGGGGPVAIVVLSGLLGVAVFLGHSFLATRRPPAR